MKRLTAALALLSVSAALLSANVPMKFWGGSNMNIDATTTFAADMNDGSTGLLTNLSMGLWFELTPYADRGISPTRDKISVALKLANSAVYAWRGYPIDSSDTKTAIENYATPDLYGQPDQAHSIWFDTFIADVVYGPWWARVAGQEPQITMSQASIRSVFDGVMSNRTASDKNSLPLPLFNAGPTQYNGNGGVVSVIGRDLVSLDAREVVISGMTSAGYKSDDLSVTVKGGSWKTGELNNDNSWIGGADLKWKPNFRTTVNANILGAVNYDTVTLDKADPMADADTLTENPLAAALGLEYRLDLPGKTILKPYAGFDLVYETESADLDWEAGGGFMWFFRGSGSTYKQPTFGGSRPGDCDADVGLYAGVNYDKEGMMNAVISLNEDPRASRLKNVGGYLQAEFLNITGIDSDPYGAVDGTAPLWAGIAQLEYAVDKKVTPYLFGKFVPGNGATGSDTDPVIYSTDLAQVTGRVGVKLEPLDHYTVDIWYESDNSKDADGWTTDKGLLSVSFTISL